MKTHVLPARFDAAKFASRYGLDFKVGQFFVGGDGLLHYPDFIPDEPIFDPPDAPKPKISERLDGVKNLPELIAVLKEVL